MSNKLKITKIELTTKDGKAVELTLEEAKDLHAQLAELFANKPVYVPSAPVIIERDRWPHWQPYQPMWIPNQGFDGYTSITCQADSGLTMNYTGQTI
jgi:hypothetical protein